MGAKLKWRLYPMLVLVAGYLAFTVIMIAIDFNCFVLLIKYNNSVRC